MVTRRISLTLACVALLVGSALTLSSVAPDDASAAASDCEYCLSVPEADTGSARKATRNLSAASAESGSPALLGAAGAIVVVALGGAAYWRWRHRPEEA